MGSFTTKSSALQSGQPACVCHSTLPTRLDYARDLASQGALAETDPAHPKLPHVRPRPSAQPAPIVLAHLEPRLPLGLRYHRFFCQCPHLEAGISRSSINLISLPYGVWTRNRTPKQLQQSPALFVRPGGGDNRHLEAPQPIYTIVVDLRKN